MVKLREMDKSSLSPGALTAYMELLLCEDNMYLLRNEPEPATLSKLIRTLSPVLGYLDKKGLIKVAGWLKNLPGASPADLNSIDKEAKEKLSELSMKSMKPWLIILLATLACCFIYWYGRPTGKTM